MSVKLYKRSITIKNLAFFSLLSIPFLHVINSLANGSSALETNEFIIFLKQENYLVLFMSFSILTILRANKISKYVFPIFCLIISFKSLTPFFQNFDKLILILNLIYVLIAIYLHLFLVLELSEPIYSPQFDSRALSKDTPFDLRVTVSFPNGESYDGYLTNWDQSNCFVIFDNKINIPKKMFSLSITFEDRKFIQQGQIISSYGTGFGIKLLSQDKKNKNIHNWTDFYTVVCDRGYFPQFSKA